MLDAYIYDGLRSPFGRHAGALATVRPDDLIATVIKNLIEKHQLPNDIFDEVLIGNTNQAGEDSRNIARNAALLAGLDVKTPGQTVNRLCASGLSTIIDAARSITCNEGDIFLAGGVESMTRAPFVFAKTETPLVVNLKYLIPPLAAASPILSSKNSLVAIACRKRVIMSLANTVSLEKKQTNSQQPHKLSTKQPNKLGFSTMK